MPFADPQEETEIYMKEHDIQSLFQDMLAYLMFNKPDDPTSALAAHLEDIKDKGKASPMLSPQDLETMFQMFDITNRQVITVQQANAALKTILGPEADISSEDLWGSATKMMKKEDFVNVMNKALQAATPGR